jgi:hypothetical protein
MIVLFHLKKYEGYNIKYICAQRKVHMFHHLSSNKKRARHKERKMWRMLKNFV